MRVQDWLGENNKLGTDIWEKKYRYNNENFDDWLDRVSNNNEEVKKLILDKKFLFGGRILSNRGIDKNGEKVTLSNCFVKGTQVLTQSGYKNIEDICAGEYVLSDDGEFHLVNETMVRDYNGDLYKISSLNLKNDIYCTPNHQFLTNHGWKRADRIFACSDQIHSSDKLKIATINNKKFSNTGLNEIIDFTDGYNGTINTKIFENENNKVVIKNLIFNHGTKTWCKAKSNYVNRYTIMDEDFAYFIGRWLGDGSVTKRQGKRNPSILQIVFNAKTEKKDFIKCKEIGEKAFGIKASVRETNQNVIALRFENEIISTWFLNHFGEKCNKKFVPDKYIGNIHMALGLCDADGSLSTHGAFKIVLKNKNLICWLRDTLYLNGINSSKVTQVERQDDTYEFHITAAQANKKLNPLLNKTYHDERNNIVCRGDYKYAQITNIEIIENYNGKVYNLSVEDTHNYTVEGVIAHNCYVISPPEDSIESIFECAGKLARTFSFGGGCGIDISKLAPRGSTVRNAAKTTTGAVSFMDLYSMITGLIGQNNRRGALMLSISCDHPDLEEFIEIKSDLDRVTKANISIRITDKFMTAVQLKKPFTLSFTRVETGETITKEVDAYSIFHKLCEMNWDYAEPGMLFWDRIENWNLLSCDDNFHYAGTNPLANLKRADLKPFLIDLDEDYNSTGRKFQYSVND